jgi:hypothetical protein
MQRIYLCSIHTGSIVAASYVESLYRSLAIRSGMPTRSFVIDRLAWKRREPKKRRKCSQTRHNLCQHVSFSSVLSLLIVDLGLA